MRKHRSFIFNRSVLLNLVITYLFIIMLGLGVNSYVYKSSLDMLENEIKRANDLTLNNIKGSMDSRLQDVIHLGTQIFINNDIRSLGYVKEDFNQFHMDVFYKLYNEFRSYKITNSFVDYFFVYYTNSEVALSSEGFFNKEELFRRVSKDSAIYYEDLYELLSQYYSKAFLTLEPESSRDSGGRKIYYIQSLSTIGSSEADVTIVVVIDEMKLIAASGTGPWTAHGGVAVLDGDNNLMGSDDVKNFIGFNTIEQLEGDSGFKTYRIKEDSYVLSYITSQITNWKYVSIVPTSVFMEKSNNIRRIISISVLFCLLTGVTSAFYFAYKNSNPIKKVAKTLSNIKLKYNRSNLQLVNNRQNEIHYIDRMVSAILEEKNVLHNKIKEKNLDLRERFIERMLKGKLDSFDDIEEQCMQYDIRFNSDCFVVLLTRFDEYDEYLDDEDNPEKNYNMSYLIIKNAIEEHINENTCYVLEVDNYQVCLINTENYNGEIINTLISTLDATREHIRDHFCLDFTTAISKVEMGVCNIFKAYAQAQEAMEYSVITGNGKTISYDSITTTEEAYYYPLEAEKQLVNYIKTGDVENSIKSIDKIFKANSAKIQNSFPTLAMVKCLMFDMIGTIAKVTQELKLNDNPEVFGGNNPLELLSRCGSILEMKLRLHQVVETICAYVEQNKKSHNTVLKEEIIEFIDKHYADTNITIPMIAEKLGVNPVYMSSFFKEQSGYSLIEYMNRVRLEKVKKFMEDPGTTLSVIAEKVGYNNDIALIRAFKKYEGITPGRYKEYIKGN